MMEGNRRKPRHNPEKLQNKLNPHCPYFDSKSETECNTKWADRCEGNRHNCKKLEYRFLASTIVKTGSDKDRKI